MLRADKSVYDWNDFAPDGRMSIMLGQRLRRLRMIHGLTLGEVARGMNSHRPIIGRIESGRHLPSIPVLRRYCATIGVPLCMVTKVIDEAAGWQFWPGSIKGSIHVWMQPPQMFSGATGHPYSPPLDLERSPDPGKVWADCLCRLIDPSDTPCIVCDARFTRPLCAIDGARS